MNEPVDAEFSESTSLALAHPSANMAPTGLFNTDDPKIVIQKAVAVADALMEIVRQKGWARRIGPKDHLEIQAWQTIAAMLGVSTECEWSRPVTDPDGWEARVIVRNARGQTIATAESQCTRKENTWKNRDDYALRSMAQTRSTSKALRMALGFIANIAGFDATPAEEMPSYDGARAQQPAQQSAAAKPARSDEAQNVKTRLLELLRDEQLIPSERDAAIFEVTGSSEPSSITSPELAAKVVAKLEKMIADAEEIPF